MPERKKILISIYVRTEIAERLALIAGKSGRSLSGLCAWILEQALKKGDHND